MDVDSAPNGMTFHEPNISENYSHAHDPDWENIWRKFYEKEKEKWIEMLQIYKRPQESS